MKSAHKAKLPKQKQARSTRVVSFTLNFRIDPELKERFSRTLAVGRPATQTDVILHLIEAYIEATERDGRQPEFPLAIIPKAQLDKPKKA